MKKDISRWNDFIGQFISDKAQKSSFLLQMFQKQKKNMQTRRLKKKVDQLQQNHAQLSQQLLTERNNFHDESINTQILAKQIKKVETNIQDHKDQIQMSRKEKQQLQMLQVQMKAEKQFQINGLESLKRQQILKFQQEKKHLRSQIKSQIKRKQQTANRLSKLQQIIKIKRGRQQDIIQRKINLQEVQDQYHQTKNQNKSMKEKQAEIISLTTKLYNRRHIEHERAAEESHRKVSSILMDFKNIIFSSKKQYKRLEQIASRKLFIQPFKLKMDRKVYEKQYRKIKEEQIISMAEQKGKQVEQLIKQSYNDQRMFELQLFQEEYCKSIGVEPMKIYMLKEDLCQKFSLVPSSPSNHQKMRERMGILGDQVKIEEQLLSFHKAEKDADHYIQALQQKLKKKNLEINIGKKNKVKSPKSERASLKEKNVQ